MPNRKTTKCNPILLCLLVLACIVPGIYMLIMVNTQWEGWESVEATLVNSTNCGKRGKNQEFQYTRLWYNFMTLEGQNITARIEDCEQGNPKIGSKRTVMYNPEDPSGEVTTAEQQYQNNMSIGLLVGGLVLGICLVLILRPKPSSQPQEGEDIPK